MQVLSKAHALLLHEPDTDKFFLMDTGSSNGTFVNNIRLSKAGQESELTEVFTGWQHDQLPSYGASW